MNQPDLVFAPRGSAGIQIRQCVNGVPLGQGWESRRMVFFEDFRQAIDTAAPVQPPPLAADVISRMLAVAQERRREEEGPA